MPLSKIRKGGVIEFRIFKGKTISTKLKFRYGARSKNSWFVSRILKIIPFRGSRMMCSGRMKPSKPLNK